MLAHVENRVVRSKVERCDPCKKYPSDAEARLALIWKGFRASYSQHFEILIICRECWHIGGPDPEGFRLLREEIPGEAPGSWATMLHVECENCGNKQPIAA